MICRDRKKGTEKQNRFIFAQYKSKTFQDENDPNYLMISHIFHKIKIFFIHF